MDPGALRRTEFDADWLRPHGFGAGMAAVLFRHGSALSALYVARPRERGSFSPAEIELLELLLPHLTGAVQASLRLAELAAARDASDHALDHWTQAVLLVDRMGRVHTANRAGEALLKLVDGLTVERSRDFGSGRLLAATPDATVTLHRLIEAAADINAASRVGTSDSALSPQRKMTLMLKRPSGRPALAALITPLAAGERAGSLRFADYHPAGSAASVAIFIFDPAADLPSASVEALLRDAYRLTASEATVAVALASGNGLGAVAATQGVTLATVRTQAQQAYRKTGVRGQAALARLVERFGRVR